MIEASVIVPSFNRPDRLRSCLAALVAQEGVTHEIVVVDDGSPEPLAPVCAAFGDAVRCIRQDNAGPARARNRGAEAARGALLAFTDDDCRPRPDWLAALGRAHGGATERLVGGRVENGYPDDPWAQASQELSEFLYDWFDAQGGGMPWFTSNNIACGRAAFHAMGGFDESFPMAAAEDRDFGMRWRDTGGALVYAPAAVVDHDHAMSLSKYWGQQSNYGRGARHLDGVLDRRGDTGPRRQAARFYLALMAAPLRRHGPRRGAATAARMVVSQLAVATGYARYRPPPARTDG